MSQPSRVSVSPSTHLNSQGERSDCSTKMSSTSSRSDDVSMRIDQYLSVTRLGREAFMDSDLQLAKDRFSLSMDIELEINVDSVCDAVTGRFASTEELRHELQARFSDSQFTPTSGKDRVNRVLHNLENAYVKAEVQVATSPNNSKGYLTMASALIAVNEWDKAKQIYAEGIARCSPDSADLERALERLEKIEEITNAPLDEKGKTKKRNKFFSRKSPRPRSVISDDNFIPRSFSFGDDENLVDIISHRGSSTSPVPPSSPGYLTLSSKRISAIASPSTNRKHRNNPFATLGKRSKSPLLRRKTLEGVMSSWSMENIASVAAHSISERGTWRNIFNPDFGMVDLNEILPTKSLKFLRHLGTLDTEFPQKTVQTIPSYTLSYASSDSSEEDVF